MSTQKQEEMDTQSVATRLVTLCSEGKFSQAQQELFALDGISIEPAHTTQPVSEGLDAIVAKGKEFQNSVAENHGGYVGDPIVAGNHFALTMGMDITTKDGTRVKMDELCVYEVVDGKIISELFFY